MKHMSAANKSCRVTIYWLLLTELRESWKHAVMCLILLLTLYGVVFFACNHCVYSQFRCRSCRACCVPILFISSQYLLYEWRGLGWLQRIKKNQVSRSVNEENGSWSLSDRPFVSSGTFDCCHMGLIFYSLEKKTKPVDCVWFSVNITVIVEHNVLDHGHSEYVQLIESTNISRDLSDWCGLRSQLIGFHKQPHPVWWSLAACNVLIVVLWVHYAFLNSIISCLLTCAHNHFLKSRSHKQYI